jgi:PhoPQ-activated pathogenicity-related protein
MLHIKNREELKLRQVIVTKQKLYYVEGVYEYGDHYQIHIRSYQNQRIDESLILMRNKKVNQNGFVYDYYEMYDSNEPHHRLSLTKTLIGTKDMFIHSIEQILKMNK